MKKIAIIGSMGMIGRPVTTAFINAGFEVSVFVLDPEEAKKVFGSKVRIVKGDFQDVNSIKEFLIGQDALYMNLSVLPTSKVDDFQAERDGLKNILEAAKTSSIKRIGYLSSLLKSHTGFKWWVLDIKKEAVKLVKQSGLVYSIFYPSTFMESFDKGGYRQGNRISLAGTSKYKMYLVSAADYGKQVVKAFELNNGNNDYVVQGLDGYIADDAAKIVVENYKKAKLTVAKAPLGVLKFIGIFVQKLNYAANITKTLNDYPEKFEAEKTWQELGKPETRFIDYIKNA